MVKLTEYLSLSRNVRTSHIDLNTPCVVTKRVSVPGKQPLLDFLNIENDVNNWREKGVQRCHLCKCDSTKGWCENPKHLYIGTVSENMMDKNPSIRKEMASSAGKKAHLLKDENGKSLHSIMTAKKIHAEKDSDGKSLVAKRAGKAKSKPVVVSDLENNVDWVFPSSAEVERVLGIPRSTLSGLTRRMIDSYKGFEVRLY